MANPDHVELARKGVEAIGLWREEHQGERLNLSGADLAGADLNGAKLNGTDLTGASLGGARLIGADLTGASLGGASLIGADLTGAKLTGAHVADAHLGNTKLRESELQDAKLHGVKGLQAGQLAGANVSNTELPEVIAKQLDDLGAVAEASKNARVVFLAMLAGCLYSVLTIGTTTDFSLLTNRASSALPVLGAEIPIVGFYWVAPLLLLCVFVYFHLYLQRLWGRLAKLPAVFPDGTALDEKAYPWLLNGLVRGNLKLLRESPPPLSRLQNVVSVLLAWWMVPLTLVHFWSRFLPRHDWLGTTLHVALITVAVGVAVMFLRLCRTTLRHEPERFLWARPWRSGRAMLLLTAGLFLALSVGAFEGRSRVGAFLRFCGIHTFAMPEESEFSTKPAGWTDKNNPYEEESLAESAPWAAERADEERKKLAGVRGIDLHNRNLEYMIAPGLFLAKANLDSARLRFSYLDGADLRGANLYRADLEEANLYRAHLEGADLEEANLKDANFYGAHLQGANLKNADLKGAALVRVYLPGADLSGANLACAHLKDANLKAANLYEARLHGADLTGANFSSAEGITVEQVKRAKNWDKARYSPDFRKLLGLPPLKGD